MWREGNLPHDHRRAIRGRTIRQDTDPFVTAGCDTARYHPGAPAPHSLRPSAGSGRLWARRVYSSLAPDQWCARPRINSTVANTAATPAQQTIPSPPPTRRAIRRDHSPVRSLIKSPTKLPLFFTNQGLDLRSRHGRQVEDVLATLATKPRPFVAGHIFPPRVAGRGHPDIVPINAHIHSCGIGRGWVANTPGLEGKRRDIAMAQAFCCKMRACFRVAVA